MFSGVFSSFSDSFLSSESVVSASVSCFAGFSSSSAGSDDMVGDLLSALRRGGEKRIRKA